MPSGTRHASSRAPDATASARSWAAEAREQARRLRRDAAATRADMTARRASPAMAAGWRSRLAAAENRSAQLERALASNRRIGIAVGILMTRLHLTDVQALELLRDASQRRNVKLRELAEDVIYTGAV
jgi:ANTAR domain